MKSTTNAMELVVTFKEGTTYEAARKTVEPVPGWHAAEHAIVLGSAVTLCFFDHEKAFEALAQLEKQPAVANVGAIAPKPKPRTGGGKVVKK